MSDRTRSSDATPSTAPPRGGWHTPFVVGVVAALITLLIVAFESVAALAMVIMEGGLSLAALAGAALAGGWLLRWMGLGEAPWRDRLVFGSALGVGLLSLLVLGFGTAGLLTRAVGFGLVGLLGVVGLARFVLDAQAQAGDATPREVASAEPQVGPWRWMWLLAMPALAIALLAACLPPGVLWAEEGFGYDILEYHLAGPKAWFEQGRIAFLPHNVYTNFPANSEMLSLLMMTLRGDAIEACFMAKMANVALAALFVAAAWLTGRTYSPRAGIVTGALAGVLPWTAYLAGIAYVEPGMLAMGMASLAAVLRAAAEPGRAQRWLLIAGLLAGLSCGFKYTTVPLIALPAAGLCLLVGETPRRRIEGALVFALGTAITFAPWLVRNALHTGNPVFPLAYSVFGAKQGVWDEELAQRWRSAHGTAGIGDPGIAIVVESIRRASDDVRWRLVPVAITMERLVMRTIGDARLGLLPFVLAGIGWARRRDRWTVALTAMLVLQVLIWVLATHQFARFAVVMLLPLVVLAARSMEAPQAKHLGRIVCAVLVFAGTWNLYRLGSLYYDHTRIGGEPIQAYGRTDWFLNGEWPGKMHLGAMNALGDNTRVMLVGEARSYYIEPDCVYATVFNHHPLADAARRYDGDAGAIMDWLSETGTTHVLAHWSEMQRLRNSYGFYPEIDGALFDRLGEAGLTPLASFSIESQTAPYATLYVVRGEGGLSE